MSLELAHLGRWVEVAELQESSELLLFLPNLGGNFLDKTLSTSQLSNLGGLGEAREEVRADESGDAVCTIDVSDGEAKYGRGDDEGGRDWKGGRVARVTRVPFEQSSSVSPG